MLCGFLADKYGRIRIIVLASLASCAGSSLAGFTHGRPMWLVTIACLWLGCWVIVETAMYKAVLTEVVPERFFGTALGLQSVAGFGMTTISPAIFGVFLQQYNPGVTLPMPCCGDLRTWYWPFQACWHPWPRSAWFGGKKGIPPRPGLKTACKERGQDIEVEPEVLLVWHLGQVFNKKYKKPWLHLSGPLQ